jgi:hypothetical protein
MKLKKKSITKITQKNESIELTHKTRDLDYDNEVTS